MKTTVVTLQFGDRPYFEASRTGLARYCERHGYELVISPGEHWADQRDMRWSKVGAIIAQLETAERVLYLDADALPFDLDRPVSVLEPLLGDCDLLLGEDAAGHANTGVMLARPSALAILQHWEQVAERYPETATTWPVDELGFNAYTLPAYRSRIALPRRVAGLDSDFLGGSFVRHFCNGSPVQKAALLSKLVGSWLEPESGPETARDGGGA